MTLYIIVVNPGRYTVRRSNGPCVFNIEPCNNVGVSCTYRTYLDIIDLTADLPSDPDDRETDSVDDVPLPEVSLSPTYHR